MEITQFTDNLSLYAQSYSPSKVFPKIKENVKKAGVKVVYGVLILYYATFDKEIPVKDRIMVTAALGYFIMPLDLFLILSLLVLLTMRQR